jgi:23S rRNA (uracil747-C5)-methyltransferase
VRCGYYDAGLCRSCTWLEVPDDTQLALKQQHVADLLAPWPGIEWLPPMTGPRERFRNKAKMVVGGTVEAPTLGILDASGAGTDLRHCGLHEPVLHDALPVVAELVTLARLTPYDVPTRRGELKHVIATASPTGRLMLRFVLRSTEAVPRLRKHLPTLLERLPHVDVVSVNLQPAHAAVLEGEHEEVLHGSTLAVPVNEVTLHLRPQGFFQTDTVVASALYAQARRWAGEADPQTVWDLYCGAGGFALHLAASGRDVTGVELSEQAVEAARDGAARAGASARFVAADVGAWITGQDAAPDLVVVNPPRRGIDPALAAWLDASDVRHLLYSSCEPRTLARDLAAMPSWTPVRARVFDMFPHTPHQEVLVLAGRVRPAGRRMGS